MSQPYYVNANGCWIWRGYVATNGYPASYRGKKIVYAHRAYYGAFVGPIRRKSVLHICDVPTCVNPSHLKLGTQADNMRDMWSKGRGAVGEKAGGAKLSAEGVATMKAMKQSGFAVTRIAKLFSMSHSQVSRILSGKRWRHL